MLSSVITFLLLAGTHAFAYQPTCETLNGYEYCEIQIEDYPEKIAVITPVGAVVNSVRFYFQGYALNPQSAYDRSLKSLVTTLKLYPTSQSERVIIPRSVGKCATYKENISKLSAFLFSLREWIPDHASLSLNAHSGAAGVVSYWVTDEEIINLKTIRIFDGIYSENTVNQLEIWKVTHPEGFLSVAYVKGWGSEKYSRLLESKIRIKENTKFYKYIPLKTEKESPHYSVVRSAWKIL